MCVCIWMYGCLKVILTFYMHIHIYTHTHTHTPNLTLPYLSPADTLPHTKKNSQNTPTGPLLPPPHRLPRRQTPHRIQHRGHHHLRSHRHPSRGLRIPHRRHRTAAFHQETRVRQRSARVFSQETSGNGGEAAGPDCRGGG